MKTRTLIMVFLTISLISCTPASTPMPTSILTHTPQSTATFTPTLTVTSTLTPTSQPTSTPIPYFEMEYLFPPVESSSLVYLKDNFGCPTDYGDKTHDGNDFFLEDSSTQIWSTTSGMIVFLQDLSSTIGYEIRVDAGSVPGITETNQELLVGYVHLTEVENGLKVGSKLTAGDRLGIGGGLNSHIHIEFRAVPKGYTGNDLGEFDVIEYWKQLYPDKIYKDCLKQ